MFKKVLVPLDGSHLSEEVLPFVKELLDGSVKEATLFTVGETPSATMRRRKGLRRPVPLATAPGALPGGIISPAPPQYVETKDQAIDREERDLLAYLNETGRPLAETGGRIKVAVQFGDPIKEITSFVRKGTFDLIAMATHGRTGLRETLHGSVTTAVIRSRVAPVLVIRPNERAARDDASSKVHVLLVNDHDDARAALVQRIQRTEQLELIGVASGPEEAVSLLEQARADIVLLDVPRRDGRGVDVCRALSETTDAPVVAFTSFMTPERWAAIREAGAADYLLKHIDTGRLSRQLARLARRAG